MNAKNRKIMVVSIIAILLAGSFLYLSTNVAVAAATVSIIIDNPPTKVGDTFIASLNVADVGGLWGWESKISWNPDVLKCTRSVKGPFLVSNDASDMRTPPIIDNVAGTIYLTQVLLETSDVSGSGVLERITFEVIGSGTANMAIDKVSLIDKTPDKHGDIPYITGSVPTITIAGSTTIPTPITPLITVSTDESSYFLGDLVSVSALVTCDGGAVSNKLVAFTVFQHDGAQVGTYVDNTDSSGKAVFTFRIPSPGDSSIGLFGEWSILAAVSVSEIEVMNSVTFTVAGQSIVTDLSITSITITNSVQKPGKVSVSITLDGIIPEGLVLTASVFDSAKVPLGMSTKSLTAQTQGTVTINAEIDIPSWAFIGQANLYINILTATPVQGGTPYCSQTTKTFEITGS
jgi:hypothetical protein